MELSRSIEGKRALVTGAASGIGRAAARLLASEGAFVAATDRPGSAIAEVVAGITADGGRVVGREMDVRDDNAVRAVVDAVAGELGGLEIVVCCAGVSLPAAFGDESAWQETLEVNLHGIHRTLRAALPWLEKKEGGRIVNVASTEALGAQPLLSAYTASKHAVLGLTRGLAVELGRKGITANAICPGPINTGMTAVIPDEAKKKFARRKVPLGRYGEPEEVAHAILSLVLPAASFINGACLVVDGGLTIQN
jgi:3-oxoacyl-[acyl-carrier protein] reductase